MGNNNDDEIHPFLAGAVTLVMLVVGGSFLYYTGLLEALVDAYGEFGILLSFLVVTGGATLLIYGVANLIDKNEKKEQNQFSAKKMFFSIKDRSEDIITLCIEEDFLPGATEMSFNNKLYVLRELFSKNQYRLKAVKVLFPKGLSKEEFILVESLFDKNWHGSEYLKEFIELYRQHPY